MVAPEVVGFTDVYKSFGERIAVRGLSISVHRGSVFGLLGPNGAGKTTSLRLILGIQQPDAGSISLALDRRPDFLKQVGYLPEERGVYRRMRVLDLLVFLAELKGVPRRHGRGRAMAWLERMDLAPRARSRVGDLSKGMQQLIQFIGTVIHEPRLVILDEPFAGLDPVNSEALGSLVADLSNAGATVILSTHVMQLAEKICDEVCVMSDGAGVISGTVDGLRIEFGGNRLSIRIGEGRASAERLFANPDMVARATWNGDVVEVSPGGETTGAVIIARLADAGVEVLEMTTTSPSLHSIFLESVAGRKAVES